VTVTVPMRLCKASTAPPMAVHCSTVVTRVLSMGYCDYARDVKVLFKSFNGHISAPHLSTPHPLQARVQLGAPEMLVNVMECQGELTETVLFCVSHLLPSLISNWCQWLERGDLEPRMDGAVECLWKTLVRPCLLFTWAVLAFYPAVQPRLQLLPGIQKACNAWQ